MGPIRQRKALSCVDCRRRKVKCDRTLPVCIRCRKGGNEANCVYVPHIGGTENSLASPPDDTPDETPNERRPSRIEEIEPLFAPWGRSNEIHRAVHESVTVAPISPPPAVDKVDKEKKMLEKLSSRVIELETYVRSAGSKPVSAEILFGIGNPMGPGYQAERNPMSDYDKVMVRGKSFSTQYFGPSYPVSILLQFDELSKYVKEIVSSVTDLKNVKRSLAGAQGLSKELSKQKVDHDLSTLSLMIPERSITDPLVEKYLEMFETTYRVLHVPSFKRDYEKYWQDSANAKADFLAQLILIMAVVYCSVPGGPSGYVGRSSARREIANRWIKACEAWVADQSKKHMTLAHVQIYVLIVFARLMSCIKIKREWQSSGHLLRLAMGAGLHREPSLLCRKISIFDCEMRRRLWFTIVELDLMASTNRGMTPSIDSMGWDCLPPSNIHDEEFDEDAERLPPSRPITEFTRTSFLCSSMKHLALRTEILGRVNSIRLHIDLENAMQYDHRIRTAIDELPTWKAEESTFASYEAKLNLWAFVLMLHVPFASQTANKVRFHYSVASKRDAAIKTLQMYVSLSDQDRLLRCNWSDNHCRAALALCHDLSGSIEDDPYPNYDHVLDLMSCINNTREERVRNLGAGFHDLWIHATAAGLVRWKMNPSQDPIDSAREMVTGITKIFHETIIANQTRMPMLDGSIEDNGSSTVVDPSNDQQLVLVDGFPGFDQLNGITDPMLDFMNLDFSSIWDLNSYQDIG